MGKTKSGWGSAAVPLPGGNGPLPICSVPSSSNMSVEKRSDPEAYTGGELFRGRENLAVGVSSFSIR